MALRIKSKKAHDLVKQIAEATGETQLQIVERALREKLAELERESARSPQDARTNAGPLK